MQLIMLLVNLINDIPDIKYGGYKVYLTIDSDAQEIAKIV